MAELDKISVHGKEYDIRPDLDLALDNLTLRMQGRGSEHDNTFDPFYYKEFSGDEQAYLDVRTWLNSLHSTEGGANPLSFLRLLVNGAWIYVLQNGLSYAQDVHTQLILNCSLMPNGGIRPGDSMYVRLSKPLANRTTTDDVWEDWRKIFDSADIDYFFGTRISGKFAPLVDGKVPAAHLPSYVDDVLEYASISSFPSEGEEGKIYLALDTNKQYRWSGTQYSEISSSLALGETSSTAFAGDRGKALETAQTTLAASVASAVDSVNTLSSTVNGKAAQADVTALAGRMTSAESDIDDLETAIEDMATQSGDNTFSGNNTFTGDTTVYDAAISLLPTPPSDPDEDPDLSEPTLGISRQKIRMAGGGLMGGSYTEITRSTVTSFSFRKMVGNSPKELATVEGMNTALAAKASTDALQTEVLRAQTAEQALSLAMAGKAATVELTSYLTQGSILPWAGVYLYNGKPVSHLRVIQDGATSYSIYFCVQHFDALETAGAEYHVFTTGDSAEGWTYVNSYDDETVPDYILRLFGENEATTIYPGRMSTNDKSHLDTLWSERGGGGGSDTFATLFAALTAEGGVIRMGDNFMDFNSNNGVSWGVLKSLLLNTNTEGSVHEIVDNHYTNRDTNYLDNEVYSDDENFSLVEMSIGQDEYAFECQGSNVIIKSGHDLYAVVLNIQPSSSVTLNIADEDNTQSTTVTLTNTAIFTEVVLDYGNTPLASSKKIYITDANGNDLEIMLQPTIKFLPS